NQRRAFSYERGQSVVSELRFVRSCGLHKNDPQNHTKSHQQIRFGWLRGSPYIAGRSLKIRKLRHYRTKRKRSGFAPKEKAGPSPAFKPSITQALKLFLSQFLFDQQL